MIKTIAVLVVLYIGLVIVRSPMPTEFSRPISDNDSVVDTFLRTALATDVRISDYGLWKIATVRILDEHEYYITTPITGQWHRMSGS